MTTGNGAFIVHQSLSRGIAGYSLYEFHPVLAAWPRLLSGLRLPRADLMHAPPEFGADLRRTGQPLVITFHNYMLDAEMQALNGLARNLYYRWLLSPAVRRSVANATRVTAVSRHMAALVSRDLQLDQPPRVIYNGVDTQQFRPRPDGAPDAGGKHFNVLFSGNLTRRKGAHLLPKIIAKCLPKVHIWYTAGLRTRDWLPAHPRMRNAGNVGHKDMPELYRRADVLLLPTMREGLSLAVAEAMATGLPVVATDCSSLPEMVEEGRGGYLCPFGDVDGIAERINCLVESPGLRREQGQFNRARAESLFELQRMVGEYRTLFEEILSS